MTIEYIRYALKAHSPDDFLAGYRTAVESLKVAPECLGYELTRCEEEANVFILRIHWASTTAHLEGFRKGANFPPFLAAIKPFIPEIAEMRHYAETPLAWTRPGQGAFRRARRRLDRRADADDIVAVTKKIDGGTRGLRDRIAYPKKAAAVLKAKMQLAV